LGERTVAERRGLAPRAKEVLLQANCAVRRLEGSAAGGGSSSAGGASGAGGVNGGVNTGVNNTGGEEEDDDEPMDVTEGALAAKRKRQIEETIDISDATQGDENLPNAVAGVAGYSGAGKVKRERN